MASLTCKGAEGSASRNLARGRSRQKAELPYVLTSSLTGGRTRCRAHSERRSRGAGTLESHIYTKNETKVWVWVTAYTVYGPGVSKIQGAWCVGPDQNDHHGLHASIREVRFEITKNHACAHPVLLDKTEFGPTDQATSSTQQYIIREEGGRFVILGGRDRY